nr:FixH family protein [Fredinandcohnia onubensis]
MRKTKFIFIFILGLFILSGCNSSTHNNHTVDLVPLKVDVVTTPESLKQGEEVTIEALVTQGDEAVTDADEVKFEIWEEGNEDHEMIEAFHSDDGNYSIKKNFTKDGIYHVIAHVTARGMHSMPAVVLIVGDIENAEEIQEVTPQHDHH